VEPQQLRINDNEFDAIGDDIKALGGPKQAAGIFFPTRTPDQGAATMRAWSNSNRAEEPDFGQLMVLIEEARKRVGFSEVARYMEQRLNCRMEFLSPEDEKARLQQQYIAAVNTLQSLAARIERNEGRK
jgi:hypothetical protein